MRYFEKRFGNFFFAFTSEDFHMGWFPRWHMEFRWRSAEDGRTWIRPTLWFSNYR